MDKKDFSGILDELKNRFVNRFLVYYIVYWLLFNWKVSVALLWYDTTQIKAEGCRSTFEFIKDQLENNSHWYAVFIWALISTILFPIIKMLILAFDTQVKVSRKNWISRINKDEYYLKNESLKQSIDKINDKSFLAGRWRVEIVNRSIVESKEESGNYENKVDEYKCFYSITDEMISEKDNRGKDHLDKFKIVNFCYTEGRKEIIFRTVLMNNYYTPSMSSYEKEKVYFLTIENDGKGRVKLTGYEKNNDVVMLKTEL